MSFNKYFVVKEDRDVNVRTTIDRGTPLCHNGYLHRNKVIKPIVEGIHGLRQQINGE